MNNGVGDQCSLRWLPMCSCYLQVLFLSDGRQHYGDPRRCGLSTAVSFAARNKLDGVVLECAALGQVPGLVAEARQLGLHVLTYGVQNDDPSWVLEQQRWGVHAAIVDDVRRVVAGTRQLSNSL